MVSTRSLVGSWNEYVFSGSSNDFTLLAGHGIEHARPRLERAARCRAGRVPWRHAIEEPLLGGSARTPHTVHGQRDVGIHFGITPK